MDIEDVNAFHLHIVQFNKIFARAVEIAERAEKKMPPALPCPFHPPGSIVEIPGVDGPTWGQMIAIGIFMVLVGVVIGMVLGVNMRP